MAIRNAAAVFLASMVGLSSAGILSADTGTTDPLVELGRKLFYSTEISSDGQLACSSCHNPKRAYTDGYERSLARTSVSPRNAPSLLNLSFQSSYGWDGRSSSVREHIREPLFGRAELASSERRLSDFLGKNQGSIQTTSSSSATDLALDSLTAYLESIATRRTKFFAYLDGNAELNELETAGLRAFNQLGCSTCHSGRALTDGEYHDLGLPRRRLIYQTIATNDGRIQHGLGFDYGRGNIESGSDQLFKFRTPSLVNVALTAPYMHDGTFRNLDEVLDFYANKIATLDEHGPQLTRKRKNAIKAFLETFSDVREVGRWQ